MRHCSWIHPSGLLPTPGSCSLPGQKCSWSSHTLLAHAPPLPLPYGHQGLHGGRGSLPATTCYFWRGSSCADWQVTFCHRRKAPCAAEPALRSGGAVSGSKRLGRNALAGNPEGTPIQGPPLPLLGLLLKRFTPPTRTVNEELGNRTHSSNQSHEGEGDRFAQNCHSAPRPLERLGLMRDGPRGGCMGGRCSSL